MQVWISDIYQHVCIANPCRPGWSNNKVLQIASELQRKLSFPGDDPVNIINRLCTSKAR